MNYIMISAHNEKHLSKIETINGIIMLNLEDGVPKDKKEIALQNIIKVLKTKPKKKIVVRVNSLDENGLNEILALKEFDIPFRIPKIDNLSQLSEVFEITKNDIHLSIETKESFFNLKDFKHKQITTFYLGILDLFDELKLPHNLITFGNPLIEKILVDFSLDSLYLEKIGIGFVYQQYKDLDGFTKWCKIQKQIGIRGVGCITPAQLEIANKIFMNEDKEYAKMIVEKFEKVGVFTIDGLFVDEPIYKNYKMILEK